MQINCSTPFTSTHAMEYALLIIPPDRLSGENNCLYICLLFWFHILTCYYWLLLSYTIFPNCDTLMNIFAQCNREILLSSTDRGRTNITLWVQKIWRRTWINKYRQVSLIYPYHKFNRYSEVCTFLFLWFLFDMHTFKTSNLYKQIMSLFTLYDVPPTNNYWLHSNPAFRGVFFVASLVRTCENHEIVQRRWILKNNIKCII